MAEHNIVVFAGDHCGPEVTDYPSSFPTLDSRRREADFWLFDRLLLRQSRYEPGICDLQSSTSDTGFRLSRRLRS